MERTGTIESGGVNLEVWSAVVEGPSAEEGSLRLHVDPRTGAPVYQELLIGSTVVSQSIRKYKAPAAQERSQLSRQALTDDLDRMRAGRDAKLQDVAFSVFGLPESYEGLNMQNVIPGQDWNKVRVDYAIHKNAPGEVSIHTYDLNAYPRVALGLASSAAEAEVKYDPELGYWMGFTQGESVIKVQARAGADLPPIRQIADDLVPIN
ncbi:MAG: hypothetical protein Kow00129_13730 [Thermoleophilia bacterium]